MKITLNRTFNEDYMIKYLDSMVMPVQDPSKFSTWLNIGASNTAVTNNYAHVVFAPKSLLDVIDTVNAKLEDGSINTDNFVIGDSLSVNIQNTMRTLFSKSKVARDSAVDTLESLGCVTTLQSTQIKNNMSALIDYNYNNLTKSYDSVEGVYSYVYSVPSELEVPYSVTNNVGITGSKESVYLVINPCINGYFNSISVNSNNLKNDIGFGDLLQFPYIATELGDIKEIGEGDIKYDQMDTIEFIDSFRFRFRLPKTLS